MPRKITIITIILLILIFSLRALFQNVYPEQIHLSFGSSLQEIVVTWVTFCPTQGSYIWFGQVGKSNIQIGFGHVHCFTQDGKVRYVHRGVLSNLKPNTFYQYACGSHNGVSPVRYFKVSPTGTRWSPRLIVYGDMGYPGAETFPYIARETSDFDVDAIIHVGDIAYNLDSDAGAVGDNFMRMIEPVASSVPYMTIVGNHEHRNNFSYYKNIFTMPGSNHGMFYSFNMGPAHLVFITTEAYYFRQYGFELMKNQYKWLKKDLKRATRSRQLRPWIIVFGHRPMYCSSDTKEDCSLETNVLRSCYYHNRNYGLEPLFQKYKVNLYLSGHMHYYERSWPLYDRQAYKGSCEEPYTNPGAVVHIITGAAGMKSGAESASCIRNDWFAFYSNEYSYTILTILNRTHTHLQQISASRHGSVLDAIWLIKTRA